MIRNQLRTLIILLLSISSFALDQESFKEIIDKVTAPYLNEIKALSTELIVDIDWKSDHPNASVSMRRGKVIMNFHGGFVRKNSLSDDALAITVCHEIGHLVGGYPKVFPTQKYSSEAQSDYFATSQCIKKYFASNSRLLTEQEKLPLTQKQRQLCHDRNSCLRGLIAIKSLSKAYPGKKDINSFSTEVVSTTNYNDYPSAQCRVDTLRAGLLCKKESCMVGPGKRPTCWYNESDKEVPNWSYDQGVEYDEAQIMGTIGTVSFKPWGCSAEVVNIDYYAPSYFNPLYEEDIINEEINLVGPCTFTDGMDVSGPITNVKGILFYNVNSADK